MVITYIRITFPVLWDFNISGLKSWSCVFTCTAGYSQTTWSWLSLWPQTLSLCLLPAVESSGSCSKRWRSHSVVALSVSSSAAETNMKKSVTKTTIVNTLVPNHNLKNYGNSWILGEERCLVPDQDQQEAHWRLWSVCPSPSRAGCLAAVSVSWGIT